MPPSVLEHVMTMEDLLEVCAFLEQRKEKDEGPTAEQVLKKYLEERNTT